jgi:glycosyltransferase involved in cell wall biosynthesis
LAGGGPAGRLEAPSASGYASPPPGPGRAERGVGSLSQREREVLERPAGGLPRVVHVASGREWRGGQHQVWLLARALGNGAGVDQVVVTGAGSELERRLRASGVAVRAPAWRAALDPRALRAVCGEARRGPCLLHAHDPHALALAGLAAAFTGRTLVATRRVDFHLRRPGFWHRADVVIATSRAVREVILQDGVAPERARVIHSGIALEEVRRTVPADLRGRLGLPGGARIAVNVAALVPHKDHATLLAAAALARSRDPDLHWVIAGDGELRREIERRIAELGLGGRVHLLGHVQNTPALIAAADVSVLTSLQEGIGGTLLDAMALGVPVVATRAGGIPEILEGGAGILVPPRDPAAVAEGVARVLGDAGLRRLLVERGREAVRRFSQERMVDQVLALYRSLAGAPPHR